jgi:hypothetical protein
LEKVLKTNEDKAYVLMYVKKDLAATVNDLSQDVEDVSVSTWKKTECEIPEPPLYSSLEKCLERLHSKVGIRTAIESAEDDGKLELVQTL